MENFTYHNDTKVHFGSGQIVTLKHEIPVDAKVLVLYGGGSIKKNGVYDQVRTALCDHDWLEFGGIEPNPQYATLMEAVELVKLNGITYLVGVGGGSVIDGCKFIAAAAEFEGDPWNIINVQAEIYSALPIACVLTLPATGSETNIHSVISKGREKINFGSELVRPKVAILDPETTLSLPSIQIANGIVDTFVHILEQYLTYPTNAKVQDRFSEGLLITLIEEASTLSTDPNNLEARANVMWASCLAMNGIASAGVPHDWATHMIGHELTALHGVTHAQTLSIILPPLLKHQISTKKDKLLQFGERVFNITEGCEEERIEETISATKQFFTNLNLPTSLKQVGVKYSDIENMVSSLDKHNRHALGERENIGLEESREILTMALD